MSTQGFSATSAPATPSTVMTEANNAPSASGSSGKRLRSAASSATRITVHVKRDESTVFAVTPANPQATEVKKRKLSTSAAPGLAPIMPAALAALSNVPVLTAKQFRDKVAEIMGGALTRCGAGLLKQLDAVVKAEVVVEQCRKECAPSRNVERVTRLIDSSWGLRAAQAGVVAEIASIKKSAHKKIVEKSKLLGERIQAAPTNDIVNVLKEGGSKIDQLKVETDENSTKLDLLEICVRGYVNGVEASAQEIATLYISTFDLYSPALLSFATVAEPARALQKHFEAYRAYVYASGLLGAIPIAASRRASRQG